VIDSASLGTPTSNYHIGAEATVPSQFFGGKIDDMRIYNIALSASEVATLYAGGGGSNQSPIADAGSDQTVTDTDENGSEQITLDGSNSSDMDGTIVSWVWSDNLGDTIPNGQTPTAALTVGTHTITLTVTDNDGATDTDTATITVNSPTVSAGLVAQWELDDGGGATAADSSGQGNTATLINGPTWTTGIVGGALSFDGINDYVTIPKQSNLITGTNDFTIAAWFNLNDVSSIKNLICWKEPSSAIQFIITNGTGNTGIWADSKWLMRISYTITTDTWHHIAWARSGNTWKVYIDGSQIGGSDVIDSASLGTPTSNYHIGAEATVPSQFFGGKIDDMRIYNSALSQQEIVALYNG